MSYKEIIATIQQLPWHRYRREHIIYLSLTTTYEFSKSLRIALKRYPNNSTLKKIEEVKLNTPNLVYNDYNKKGCPSLFLAHFIATESFMRRISDNVFWAREYYWRDVDKLGESNKKVPALITYSRIQEFPSVLKQILNSHDWENSGCGFYKYYLERTITLDIELSASVEVKKDFEPSDIVVLEKFYETLLVLYKSLETYKCM